MRSMYFGLILLALGHSVFSEEVARLSITEKSKPLSSDESRFDLVLEDAASDIESCTRSCMATKGNSDELLCRAKCEEEQRVLEETSSMLANVLLGEELSENDRIALIEAARKYPRIVRAGLQAAHYLLPTFAPSGDVPSELDSDSEVSTHLREAHHAAKRSYSERGTATAIRRSGTTEHEGKRNQNKYHYSSLYAQKWGHRF